jgi:D-alanine-D-alanine ligase
VNIGLTYTLKTDMEKELRSRNIPIGEDTLEEYDKPETVTGLCEAIRAAGHTPLRLGWGKDLIYAAQNGVIIDFNSKSIRFLPGGGSVFQNEDDPICIDLVFNIAEGYGGRSREAQVPAFLEMFGVPYVGSDPMALAVSLDKHASKTLARAKGVTVPQGILVQPGKTMEPSTRWSNRLEFPLIVKPAYEGSSKGIRMDSVVQDDDQLKARVQEIHVTYKQPAIVEEYIWGREVTVGIIGDPPRVLGVMEIVPKDKSKIAWTIYSLEVKRHWQEVADYRVNPEFPHGIREQLEREALDAFDALGCKDFARVDFRLRGTGQQPVFLEINPLPGLNEGSDLPLLAKGLGMGYEKLIGEILEGAIRRTSR